MEAESHIIVAYPVTPADIEATRAAFSALTCADPKGYESVVKAIATCRTTRVAIEERRKYLKADSLAYGRKVDAVAKELTALVESIEHPLRAKKSEVDEAKARAKAEKEAAERAAVEAQLKAERDAEEARMAEERARIAAEQAELRLERQRLEAESMALRAQQAEACKERQAVLREAERLAQAEATRVLAERRKEEQAKRDAELAPDLDKVRAFAALIRSLVGPTCESHSAKQQVEAALGRLSRAADGLDAFVELGS